MSKLYFLRKEYLSVWWIRQSYLFLIPFLFVLQASAQETIQGIVLDQDDEPVPWATVAVKSTTSGTTTDLDGTFSLKVEESLPVTLSISFVGYKTHEIEVDDTDDDIRIVLEEDVNLLDEVVITGYTVERRRSVTAAIESVDFDEAIANQADQDLTKLLQGKASGVQIVSTSGNPGGGVSLVIRGNNSINGSVAPLYVVDGVFISSSAPVGASGGNLSSNPLADINPADIESISILKDANATSIYGSQGANGVVVITTKRGDFNSASRINFTGSHGWSDAVKRWDATTGPETGLLLNEVAINTAADEGRELSSEDLPYPDYQSLPTYDRISGLFQAAQSSDYQLSAQGGDANSSYYTGLGYTKQESIVKPTVAERFSGRINYDKQATDNLKVGTSLHLSRTNRENVYGSDNNPGGVIGSAIFPRSFLPIFNEDGGYAAHATFNNHLLLIEHLNNNYGTWRGIGNLFAEYSILPELKFRSSWSVDYVHNHVKSFSDFALSSTGSSFVHRDLETIYTAEQLLTYLKDFGKSREHLLNVLIGNTINARKHQSLRASASDYLFDQLTEINNAAITTATGTTAENRLVSFFGKVGYTFDEKYSIDASFRADGSSRFGTNVRWGYFPSIGFNWNAGDEPFIRSLNLFDGLRFRTSFGFAGNQSGIGNYVALGTWSSSSSSYLDQPGLSPGQLPNPDLTWEKSRQFNIGTDFDVFDSRISVGLDVYHKYTYNMLLDVTTPSRSGYSSYTDNYGALSNRGVELSLNTLNFVREDFSWNTQFNISANRNRIEKIPQEQTLGATDRGTSILREGYPVNSFFLYKQLYVDPETGNAVYEDVDGDGLITYADRQIVGKALPDYTGGLTNTLNYKNFELNAFFYFTVGNDLLNMREFFLVHGGRMGGIGFVPRQLDRWQKPGDVTDVPRLTTYSGNPNENGGAANNYGGQVSNLSTRYLEDGSFLRLKNLALSYDFSNPVISKLNIERLKLTLSATNLWTLTNYSGPDPEVSAQSSNQNTAGYDWATVPQPRTFQVILNLTL